MAQVQEGHVVISYTLLWIDHESRPVRYFTVLINSPLSTVLEQPAYAHVPLATRGKHLVRHRGAVEEHERPWLGLGLGLGSGSGLGLGLGAGAGLGLG